MKKREGQLEQMRRNQAQVAARRLELLERLKVRPTPVNRAASKEDQAAASVEQAHPPFDVAAAMEAAQQLRLMKLDTSVGDQTQLNRPTLALVRQLFEVLASGESAAVLQWPFAPGDVSVLHPLAMVALLRTPVKRTTGNFVWCDPAVHCRTLYFPWRGGASLAGQRYLVRRTDLTDWNKYHLTRRTLSPRAAVTISDKLHETIGHLTLLRVRETTKPHLAHPWLGELYPTFTAMGGEDSAPPFGVARNELFGRVRFGAALDRMTDHRAALAAPDGAPYGLFAVAHDADLRRALAARSIVGEGLSPHICILDLNSAGLKRLGPSWAERVEEFIAESRKRFPRIAFLAVTNDPFVHRRVETLIRGRTTPKQLASRVVVRISHDILGADPVTTDYSPVDTRFSTTAGPASDAIAALSEAANRCVDPALAGTLRREMGALRKAASLPCGSSAAYEILCDKLGQTKAEAFLAARSAAALIAPIDDALASEITATERAHLSAARTKVAAAFKAIGDETPIGSLTADLMVSVVAKSSRSILAFSSVPERILAEHRFADGSPAGQRLRRKIDSGFIRFVAVDELPGSLATIEKDRDRNSWKRLVLVAPTADQVAAVVTRQWLPDELTVLCERRLAARLGDIFHRLSAHPDLGGQGKLGERLASVAGAAKAEVDARGASSIELDLTPTGPVAPVDDDVIDLTDDDADDEGVIVTLKLASGRRLRARPGLAIVRYNHDADFNPFERTTAREVQPFQSIVVPDATFTAEAKEILPIRVLAEKWVDVFHTLVEAKLPEIEGETLHAKARTIIVGMQRWGARTPTAAAVVDWLRVSEHRQLPPDQRRSHAPQRRPEFVAFLSTLGIDEVMAERMWREGIQPLRSDRRRAGRRMAQAFVSVLVDPHGTASHFNLEIREKIRDLRAKALDYLDQVVAREETDSEAAA